MDNTPHGFEDPLSDIDPIMEQAFSVGASDVFKEDDDDEQLNATVTPPATPEPSYASQELEQATDYSDDMDNTPLSEEQAQVSHDDLSDLSDDLFSPEPVAPAPAAEPAAPQSAYADATQAFSQPGPAETVVQPGENFASQQQPAPQSYAAPEPVQEPSYVTPEASPYSSESAAPSQQEQFSDLDSQISIPVPPPAAPPAMGQPDTDYNSPSNLNYVEFPDLQDAAIEGKKLEDGVLSSIPVKVSVELGRSHLSLQEVYELTEGSIIELERLVGEPLDLVINGQVIAQGEVVAIDNKYGLRIKNLTSNKTVA